MWVPVWIKVHFWRVSRSRSKIYAKHVVGGPALSNSCPTHWCQSPTLFTCTPLHTYFPQDTDHDAVNVITVFLQQHMYIQYMYIWNYFVHKKRINKMIASVLMSYLHISQKALRRWHSRLTLPESDFFSPIVTQIWFFYDSANITNHTDSHIFKARLGHFNMWFKIIQIRTFYVTLNWHASQFCTGGGHSVRTKLLGLLLFILLLLIICWHILDASTAWYLKWMSRLLHVWPPCLLLTSFVVLAYTVRFVWCLVVLLHMWVTLWPWTVHTGVQ